MKTQCEERAPGAGPRLSLLPLLPILALLSVAAPGTASAHTFLDTDALRLELQGWAQGGFAVSAAPGSGEVDHAPYIGLARVFAEARHKRWGRAVVHVEGASGEVELLDAIGELTPIPQLTLRMGKFKAPTSVDYLIPAPYTSFVNRGLLVELGLVQRRLLGGEVLGTVKGERLSATLQLGWFVPGGAQRALLPDEEGVLLSARALVSLWFGLHAHLAFMELVLADNAPVLVPTDPPGSTARRPVPNDRQLDAAIYYKAGSWLAYVEGVVVLDGPDGSTPFGLYAMALRNIELPVAELSIEPGLRYGVARADGRVTHRVTAGATLYLVGDHLNTSVNYELIVDAGQTGHAAYMQIQAGF